MHLTVVFVSIMSMTWSGEYVYQFDISTSPVAGSKSMILYDKRHLDYQKGQTLRCELKEEDYVVEKGVVHGSPRVRAGDVCKPVPPSDSEKKAK
jgi:hypothetical protein